MNEDQKRVWDMACKIYLIFLNKLGTPAGASSMTAEDLERAKVLSIQEAESFYKLVRSQSNV